jgi:hypothetical protein
MLDTSDSPKSWLQCNTADGAHDDRGLRRLPMATLKNPGRKHSRSRLRAARLRRLLSRVATGRVECNEEFWSPQAGLHRFFGQNIYQP